MNVEQSLQEILDQNYSCAICLENYNEKRKPILTCNLHDVCMECFKQINNNLCPTCKQPWLGSKVVVNSQKQSSLDLVKKIWEQKNSQQASCPQPLKEEAKPLIPEQFGFFTLCEMVWQYKHFEDQFQAALPYVLDVMQWRPLVRELLTSSSKNWFLLTDSRNQSVKGFVQLMNKGEGHFEAHWGGVTEQIPELYLELYKRLLATVLHNSPINWQETSLTLIFNYDTEEKWLKLILKFLLDSNIRYDLLHIHRNWGTQSKLIAYPCCKPGHEQKMIESDPGIVLEGNVPFEQWILPRIKSYLENPELNQLFRIAGRNEENFNLIKRTFATNPQNFFIYMIEGKPAGFIEFDRYNGELLWIQQCALFPDCYKYKQHFISQFKEWATTKPSLGPDKCARQVEFSPTVPAAFWQGK